MPLHTMDMPEGSGKEHEEVAAEAGLCLPVSFSASSRSPHSSCIGIEPAYSRFIGQRSARNVMAPTRRSARHASTGTPTSGVPSPGVPLMESLDMPARFSLHDGADDLLMDRDSMLLGHDDDVSSFADGSMALAGERDEVSTLPMDLQLDLGLPLDLDTDNQLASAVMHLEPSLPGTQLTATEGNSTESEDGADDPSANDDLADLSGVEDEDEDDDAGLPDVEDFGDDMTGAIDNDLATSIANRNNAPSPATSASIPLRRGRARDDDSHAEDDDTSTGTDDQRPSKRQKRGGSRLSRSAVRKRSRSSSTLSSALSDVAGLVSKGDDSAPGASHDNDEEHDDAPEDRSPDPNRADKDRRDAEDLSRLRRGSPDSQFSASASDEDEDDVPLQAIVQSKVNNNGQTASKASSKTASGRTAVSGAQTSGKGPGRKGQGHKRKPSGSISQGSAVHMSTNTAADVAIAEDQAAKQPNKSLGTSRTVPDVQPGTPHADLHNGVSTLGPNGEPEGLLNDAELRQAIETRVKFEDDIASLPTTQPVASVGVEAMVRGQAVDDEEIIQDLKPRERPAQLEERLGIIRFVPVTSSRPSIVTSILLTGLKNIFQRQLPKMPREYITRLVFDRNHWSMAIVKTGYQVVGGITYRPFDTRGFGEIVFCAITGTEQVRGYGSHLMNHLKDWVKLAHPNINHFLTYADNYAFGYFKKQGFTKDLTLPRSVWAGYIKDYEGATIMQCSMLPKISYLQAAHMLLRQKQLILTKIRERSSTHIVHSGRDLFAGRTRVDPSEVAALRAIGWDPSMDALTRRPERGPQHAIMRRLLTDMQNHPASWAFASPVNAEEVTDYYTAIKNPMDLETMENKLNANRYQMPRTNDDGRSLTPREGLELFLRDAQLIFDNCRQYNSESSNYSKNAEKLRSFLRERVKAYTEE